MKRALWTLFGVVGAIASVAGLHKGILQTLLVVVCTTVVLTALALYVSDLVALKTCWRVSRQCKRNGILAIPHPLDLNNRQLSDRIKAARTVRIMAVSAESLIRGQKMALVKAIADRGAHVRVLIADPRSSFVQDVEDAEPGDRRGAISAEIVQARGLLSGFVTEAAKQAATEPLGITITVS